MTIAGLIAIAGEALAAHRLAAVEILRADPVRRTVTARVARRSARSTLVAKWIAPDAPPRARGSFENEVRFYRDEPRDALIPEAVDIDRDLIVLVDEGGQSLRTIVAEIIRRPDAEHSSDVRALLRDAFVAVAQWTTESLEAAETDARDETAFERRLTALRMSLAMGGQDIRTPASAVGAALERATRPGFIAAARPIVHDAPGLATIGRSHGALECRNILVTRDGRVVLVDFTASSPTGSVALDLVAAVTSAIVATSSKPGLRALVRDAAATALQDQRATAPLATAVISLAEAIEPIGRQNHEQNPGADTNAVVRERLALVRAAVSRPAAR
jgi:hypothetical protein